MTNNAVKILGLGGGLRVPSTSLSVLKLALEGAVQAGAEADLIDLNELELPFFRPGRTIEDYPDPAYIRQFLTKFEAAQGFLWSAPTYHGTPSATFKNALDFLELLPRQPHLYLTGKVGGLLTVAGGPNAGPNSLTSLIYNARALRMLIAPSSLQISPARKLFDANGHLTDERLIQQIIALGAEVTSLARQLKL